MTILFQLFLTLFAAASLVRIVQKKQEKYLGRGAATLWFFFWILAIIVVWWPEGASRVAETLGIGRGVDVVVYSVLAICAYLLFRFELRLEAVSQQMTSLVRDRALHDVRKKN